MLKQEKMNDNTVVAYERIEKFSLKNPWTPQEDAHLLKLVSEHGTNSSVGQ